MPYLKKIRRRRGAQGILGARRQGPAPEPAVTPTQAAAPVKATRRVQASPPARALARRLGLDISLIPGSGNSGYITAPDVQHYATSGIT